MTDSNIRRLRRAAASIYLEQRWGIERKPSTLAKLACLGGGPRFQHVNRVPVYLEAELDAWAESILSPLKRSTSDPGQRLADATAMPPQYQTDAATPTKEESEFRTNTESNPENQNPAPPVDGRSNSRARSHDGKCSLFDPQNDAPDQLSHPRQKRTRWHPNRRVEPAWLSEALQLRITKHLEAVDMRVEASKFVLYFTGNAGPDAEQVDWHRRWLLWALQAQLT